MKPSRPSSKATYFIDWDMKSEHDIHTQKNVTQELFIHTILQNGIFVCCHALSP